jgi:hypothetical protein
MAGNVSITYRPLSQWPQGRARTSEWMREDSPFVARGGRKTPLSTTLVELDRELWMIGAKGVVVQLDIDERQLRNDGGIRADARAKTPGAVLSFVRNKMPYVFATDFFKRWEDNLRAITLGLEGLRRIERFHIGQSGDQYRGWQALPAVQAATLIARLAGSNDVEKHAADILEDSAGAIRPIRIAKSNTHPDAGGRNEDWTLLQEAERIVIAHHGGKL